MRGFSFSNFFNRPARQEDASGPDTASLSRGASSVAKDDQRNVQAPSSFGGRQGDSHNGVQGVRRFLGRLNLKRRNDSSAVNGKGRNDGGNGTGVGGLGKKPSIIGSAYRPEVDIQNSTSLFPDAIATQPTGGQSLSSQAGALDMPLPALPAAAPSPMDELKQDIANAKDENFETWPERLFEFHAGLEKELNRRREMGGEPSTGRSNRDLEEMLEYVNGEIQRHYDAQDAKPSVQQKTGVSTGRLTHNPSSVVNQNLGIVRQGEEAKRTQIIKQFSPQSDSGKKPEISKPLPPDPAPIVDAKEKPLPLLPGEINFKNGEGEEIRVKLQDANDPYGMLALTVLHEAGLLEEDKKNFGNLLVPEHKREEASQKLTGLIADLDSGKQWRVYGQVFSRDDIVAFTSPKRFADDNADVASLRELVEAAGSRPSEDQKQKVQGLLNKLMPKFEKFLGSKPVDVATQTDTAAKETRDAETRTGDDDKDEFVDVQQDQDWMTLFNHPMA